MRSQPYRWLLVAGTLLLSACSTLSFGIANLPARFARSHRDADVRFGPQDWQKLDIYRPAHPPGAAPVIVFWYGGSWTQGDKEDYRFVGAALAGLGYVVVLPEYRLYPQVRFPQFLDDAAEAVAWVERHAADYGGDPHRIVLMGHSAGAHMAAMLAMNDTYLRRAGADPADISGLIGLSGPYQLTPNDATLNAIFTAPYTPHDWQVLPFVSARAPPTLLIHGAADKVVWPRNSERLAAALAAAGVPVVLRIYPGRAHAATVAALTWVLRWRSPTLADIGKFMQTLPGSRAVPPPGLSGTAGN
jgi:acetyl esterase/lipase